MYYNKSEIYKLFDKEGIRVTSMSQLSMSFGQDEGLSEMKEKNIYIPILDKFDMTESDFKQLVVDYIYDTTSINIESINNLDKYPSVNGLPFLLKLENSLKNQITFSLAFGKIPGSVTIRQGHKIKTLGNIEEINGDLALIGSGIESLGKLKTITGSLWIAQFEPYTNLIDLGNLEIVGKDLYLKGSPIQSLSKLKKVGGTLNLRKTDIQTLGDLEHVGNHIYLPKSKNNVFDFSKITIQGKVKYFS